MKLSDYVVGFIADFGIRHVFMLPGGGAMHLNDSLGHYPGIEYVCMLHEQAAAIAAEAYARVTNNLGVAMVTTGPGGTNALTGVAGAWLDSTPCLFISGQVKRPDMKRDLGVRQLGVQEVDIVSLVQSITKYAVTVTDPLMIRYHLEKAAYLAKSGRPGPVWIDIPLDVLYDLGRLCGLDVSGDKDVGDEPVQLGQKASALLVHAGDDLGYLVNAVRIVAGIHPLRRVAYLEIPAAFHSRLLLQNGYYYLLSDAGIDCRFQYYYCATLEVSAYNLSR